MPAACFPFLFLIVTEQLHVSFRVSWLVVQPCFCGNHPFEGSADISGEAGVLHEQIGFGKLKCHFSYSCDSATESAM